MALRNRWPTLLDNALDFFLSLKMSVQLICKRHAFLGAEGLWSAGLNAAGSQAFHEVAHIQTCSNVFHRVELASRIEGVTTAVDHFSGQGDVASDHQIIGFKSSQNLVISHIKPGLDAHRRDVT